MEDIQKAVKTCFNKYADFTGRATRSEFWWFFLFQVIVLLIAGAVSDILYGVVALGLLLPGLAVGARRLHDIGKTGWLLLLWIIPSLAGCCCSIGPCSPAVRRMSTVPPK